MRCNTLFAAAAIAATAIAAPQRKTDEVPSAEPTMTPPRPALHHLMGRVPAQLPTDVLPATDGPKPTLPATTPAPGAPTHHHHHHHHQLADAWYPFSWGPWMLPPQEDVTELAPGRWQFALREGITCVATSAPAPAPSADPMTADPVMGCDGTGFCWGLPPRARAEPPLFPSSPLTPAAAAAAAADEPVEETMAHVAVLSPAAFASEEHSSGRSGDGACRGECDGLAAGAETDGGAGTIVPLLSLATNPRPDVEPLALDAHAIPTLSASPEPFPASSAWVDGLPPPIPFGSLIQDTLTLAIPEHGTRVADSSTWFGPWPTSSTSSTARPFVTSPLSTSQPAAPAPTTLRTHTTTPAITPTSSSGSSTTSIRCHEAYCAEDGTSYCFYWAGVTAMGQQGPQPGETRVPLGKCTVGAAPSSTDAAAAGGSWLGGLF